MTQKFLIYIRVYITSRQENVSFANVQVDALRLSALWKDALKAVLRPPAMQVVVLGTRTHVERMQNF